MDPQSGDQIPGLYELQGALGSHVKSVADLAMAHAAPQKCLNTHTLSSEVRAAGANRYANNKDRRAKKIINDKKLDIDFKAITFGTYGAFGSSTHSLIKKATADAQESVFCPWVLGLHLGPGSMPTCCLVFL